MKICVINGSPKGKNSITLQTVNYLEKLFPEHSFAVIHAAQKIRAYEKDMKAAAEEIIGSDLVIFSYPVYTFLAPSQLHRFIALMKRCGTDFSGKFVTQITTSKHFYDVTAHRYIEDNCNDMKMRVIHGLSADMDDLTTEQGQADAENFMKYAVFCVQNGIFEPAPTITAKKLGEYVPAFHSGEKDHSLDTVIVADLEPNDERLSEMIEDFKAAYPYATRLVNIADYKFSGGCLGCFNCAAEGKCVHKDGFDNFLRERIQLSDAVVYAFTIKDHSMGYRFKTYDDRQFCNGHRTVTEGISFGYIVNGDYESEPNLRTVIEARCEVGHNFLSGVGYDSETVGNMAKRLAYAIENRYIQPRNFYGVGGMKIFRDLIWVMRGLMKADHEFYKKHGIYDFPQKQRGRMIGMLFIGAMMRNPKMKEKMNGKMNEGMLMPYAKALQKAEKLGRERTAAADEDKKER